MVIDLRGLWVADHERGGGRQPNGMGGTATAAAEAAEAEVSNGTVRTQALKDSAPSAANGGHGDLDVDRSSLSVVAVAAAAASTRSRPVKPSGGAWASPSPSAPSQVEVGRSVYAYIPFCLQQDVNIISYVDAYSYYIDSTGTHRKPFRCGKVPEELILWN